MMRGIIMANATLLVLSRANEGRIDEMGEWYKNQHISDVLAVDGIEAAQLFRTSGDFDFVCQYELGDKDPQQVVADLVAAGRGGQMVMTDAMDRSAAKMLVIHPFTERRSA
jgi:hypothetical protein